VCGVMAINKIALYRQLFLNKLLEQLMFVDNKGVVNIADRSSATSKKIAKELLTILGDSRCCEKPTGQSAGRIFAQLVKEFLEKSLAVLSHLRPIQWELKTETEIFNFNQYEHLARLSELVKQVKELQPIMGADYLVKPDIVLFQHPLTDNDIGFTTNEEIPEIANLTPLRAVNNKTAHPLLQAIVSCKWTIRSDRAQNTRTEALNILRNRKGRTPCITAITAEPLPSRIASLAFGLGDLDCVYHFALPELQNAVTKANLKDQLEVLQVMIEGKRLRDVGDLPFDLII